MSKILHIDTDLQIPNRILKDDTNKVKQITDKAQNIAFTQSDPAKQPIYSHDGHYELNDTYFDFDDNGVLDFSDGDFTIEFWLRRDNTNNNTFLDLRTTGFGMIITCQNYIGLYMSINGSSWAFSNAAFGNIPDTTSFHHYAIVRKNNIWSGFVDGVLKDRRTLSGSVHYNLGQKKLFTNQSSSVGLQGGVKSLLIYKYAKYDSSPFSTSDEVFIPKEPFIYYHRYKDDGNKKLYLSSKYLEGAVIDESSISVINSSIIGEGAATRRTGSGEEPLITDRGISFDGSQRFLYNQANAEDCFVVESLQSSPQARMTIGFWCKVDASGGAPITTTIKYSKDGQFVDDWLESRVGYPHADKLSFWQYGNANVNNVTTINDIVYGVWAYYCLLFDTDTMYFFKDGVFQGSSPLVAIPANVETNYLDVVIGGRWRSSTNNLVGLMDDVLVSTSLLVNPTGYSVGDKVFEPPRRGGFESEIKQYPIPT